MTSGGNEIDLSSAAEQNISSKLRITILIKKIECSRCNSCYVSQTSLHLQTRFKEHLSSGPVQQHFKDCDMDLISFLGTTSKGEITLLTLEALWIRDVKPQLNTKDEFRSRALTIKL